MSKPTDEVSLAQLRCFIAVIDAGSFAGAARHLALTTSGVSKILSRLEVAYGLRLLHRSTHSISPTSAGERLIEPARIMLEGAASIGAILTDASDSGTIGIVRIGAPSAFVRRCLAPLVSSFLDAHPGIVLDLRASDTTVDLAEAGLDLAIRSGSIDNLPGHVRIPWFDFDWVACACPIYLGRHGEPKTPDDLIAHRLIGFRNTRTGLVEPWRLRADSFPRASSWQLITDDGESALQASMGGAGIMWAPHWLAAAPLASGEVREVLSDWRGGRMPFSIIRRGQPLVSDRVRTVVEFLRARASFCAGGCSNS